MLDIPIVAGAVGALIFTGATAVGILAALATGCELMIVKENDDIIDIREILEDTAETVKEKAEEVMKSFSSEEEKEAADFDQTEDETDASASPDVETAEDEVKEDDVVIKATFIQPDKQEEEKTEE